PLLRPVREFPLPGKPRLVRREGRCRTTPIRNDAPGASPRPRLCGRPGDCAHFVAAVRPSNGANINAPPTPNEESRGKPHRHTSGTKVCRLAGGRPRPAPTGIAPGRLPSRSGDTGPPAERLAVLGQGGPNRAGIVREAGRSPGRQEAIAGFVPLGK